MKRQLSPASGLTEFGASHVTLLPGAWSSQRHWHLGEDEFLVMLAGEAVLVEDEGETVLVAGDCAAFPRGVENGHHLQNRSDRDALILEMGSRRPEVDAVVYPDIDLKIEPGGGYLHRDGAPYPKGPRRSA